MYRVLIQEKIWFLIASPRNGVLLIVWHRMGICRVGGPACGVVILES